MKQITVTEKRFYEFHEDDISVTLRGSSGSCGGGGETLVIYTSTRQTPENKRDKGDGCIQQYVGDKE